MIMELKRNEALNPKRKEYYHLVTKGLKISNIVRIIER